MNEIFFTVALGLMPPALVKDSDNPLMQPRIVEHFYSLEECEQAQPYLERLQEEEYASLISSIADTIIRSRGLKRGSDEAKALHAELTTGMRVECHATTYAMPPQ